MRRLSREDRELWAALRRTVRPLRGRREDLAEAVEPKAEQLETKPPKPAAPPAAQIGKPRPKSPALPIAPVEERLRRRLARGLADVDARIDLHGMRQERAFAALVGFLRQSQLRGARLVLVITGKDRGETSAGDGAGRGVLRRTVPGWLTRPDLRELVSGFEEAGRRHGGDGALYVRIRRRRAGRE